MRLVRHNIRLPASLDNALRSLAKHQGTSAYAVLQQCVQAGIATLADAPAAGFDDPETVDELASLGTRILDVERLLDRRLFTACAAYAYGAAANQREAANSATDTTIFPHRTAAFRRCCD